MKLPYYLATKGLERFPANERFAIYRSTHKRLLKEDAVYRNRCTAYLISVVCALIVGGIELVSLVVFSIPNSLQIAMAIFSLTLFVPTILYLAFRQQGFMNQRIGEALQKTS